MSASVFASASTNGAAGVTLIDGNVVDGGSGIVPGVGLASV